jgi:Skp family chaperone for outer membrane proteins
MTRTLIAAIALVAASTAFAESPTIDNTAFVSTKTRAQVTADYVQSRNVTAALTAEDSGSAYLATRTQRGAAPVVAGQPTNAQ